MTREHRTAMGRIISDMIKADNIIEKSEIKDMKKLMSEYAGIHRQRLAPTALFAIFARLCCCIGV